MTEERRKAKGIATLMGKKHYFVQMMCVRAQEMVSFAPLPRTRALCLGSR